MGDWWQSHTDGLVGTGAMLAATICGIADGSYWAYTGDHVPQPDEVAHIIACLKDPSKAKMNGFKIAGNNYFVLRAEERLLMGKLGNGGCVISASAQAFTCRVFGGNHQPMLVALKEVENMISCLKELGC